MIDQNYRQVIRRITEASVHAGNLKFPVTLVAVTKGRSVEEIKEALRSGVTDIGENRIQEAFLKYNAILNTQYPIRPKWHMVGHLQTNKARDAVRIFDLIHSVDSLRLAEEIDRQAARAEKVQDILIEVKTSPEETKYGIVPDELSRLLQQVKIFKNVRLQGLMTIAPAVDNPQKARPYFKMLRELRDSLRAQGEELGVLSMGMTDDFEVAIEEGSNMVRLGRALFEA